MVNWIVFRLSVIALIIMGIQSKVLLVFVMHFKPHMGYLGIFMPNDVRESHAMRAIGSHKKQLTCEKTRSIARI